MSRYSKLVFVLCPLLSQVGACGRTGWFVVAAEDDTAEQGWSEESGSGVSPLGESDPRGESDSRGESDPRRESESRGESDSGDGTRAESDSPLGVPPGFEGAFHLPEPTAAINLQLRSDETFHWNIDACDVTGSGAGKWILDGDSVLLLPEEPGDVFMWPGRQFTEVETVELIAGPSGTFRALLGVPGGATRPAQVWVPGGICPDCGGETLTPTGMHRCPDPLPA